MNVITTVHTVIPTFHTVILTVHTVIPSVHTVIPSVHTVIPTVVEESRSLHALRLVEMTRRLKAASKRERRELAHYPEREQARP